MKELDKKIGPLKLWQWLVIGGGTGILIYLYEKKKSSEGINPEEEEKLLGALSRGGGGGGEGSTGSSGSSLPVPGLEGPAGAPGPAGPQGPVGEAPARTLEAQVENLEKQTQSLQSEVAKNNPPAKSHTSAPQALPKGYVKNKKGEAYRTVVKGNGIFHEYKNRTGPSKVVKIGTVHKAAPKPKRTSRPKPVAHKIAPKKHPVPKKKKEPVHR